MASWDSWVVLVRGTSCTSPVMSSAVLLCTSGACFTGFWSNDTTASQEQQQQEVQPGMKVKQEEPEQEHGGEKRASAAQTHVQHEFGVGVDEFDQSEKKALVTPGVEFCGFLFEFKAGGHLPFERQTLGIKAGQR